MRYAVRFVIDWNTWQENEKNFNSGNPEVEKRQEHILYYPGAAAESEPMGFSGEEYKKVILESSCIWQKHEKYMDV